MIIQNIVKLSNAVCQILVLLLILDQIVSQCGIRWRGTCGCSKSVTKTNLLERIKEKTN